MATYENIKTISRLVKITSGVAAALKYRFCTIDSTVSDNPSSPAVVTHVPAATGAAARGIVAMNPDTKIANGYVSVAVAMPGGDALVELGEAVTTIGAALRIGGNSSEVDGAAYLADATGDVIVAYALKTGVVGEVIPIQFVGYAGTAP